MRRREHLVFKSHGPLKLVNFSFVQLLDPLKVGSFHILDQVHIEIQFADSFGELRL
jgi:hypothetical protein